MSCLIIKNDGIGDLVLCSGILFELSNKFNGNLDLVTCETNREVAKLIPGIRQIYYVSRDNLRFPKGGIHRPPIDEDDNVVLIEIALQKYDVAICLRRFIRQSSLIIMNCISAKEKYCCWQIPTNATWEEAENLSRDWNHYRGNKRILSELEYFEVFCSTIFNTNICAPPSFSLEGKFDEVQYNGKAVAMGISGSSTQPGAIWAELAKYLADDGWTVHLFGGIQQSDTAIFITKLAPSVINHVGKLTITRTLKYLNRFKYFVGTDTGLSHLASLVVPNILVVIGGGTFPRFFPWPDRPSQHVIFYGLDCYDCDWQCKYPSRYCLELISPKIVLDYFLKIVEGECVTRLINLGNPSTKYQPLWKRSKIEQEKVSFYDLHGKIEDQKDD